MNVKFTLLGLFLIFSSVVLKSQTEFAPAGAEWIFNYSFNGNTGYQRVSVQGDTIIHNKVCKKLLWGKVFLNNVTPEQDTIRITEGYRYTHQSRDTIFYYDNGKDEFTVLFAFDAEVGDTIRVPISSKHPFYSVSNKINFIFRTTSVSTLTIGGSENVKVLEITPDCNVTDVFLRTRRFIERIGTTSFLFFNEVDCYFRDEDWSLRCYSDNEISYHVSQNTCDVLTSSRMVSSHNQLKIYPNPASENLFIETDEKIEYLLVFDVYGKLIKKLNSTSSISVSEFSKGVYWLEALDRYKNRLGVSRFIVK